ncbi:MAG: TetR/AcrR family transcriptional regulator [Treponema sp.]|nr:TetR/AcrR family transcriptional regulator [Treponema sp.]MCL2251345.1 TetR/AcrR family transcriptional regulator [Treponema sp.]
MTKIEIVDAAFKVWGRNFYRKTSLSQLACELKVSKPAFYRHFDSKQALISAMSDKFLDDFASCIREDFNAALQEKDTDKGIYIIVKSVAGFFAQNVYALIFSLMNIYERNIDGSIISQKLKDRGADMSVFQRVVERKYFIHSDYSNEKNPDQSSEAKIIRLVFATLTFFMSHFHKINKTMKKKPSVNDIQNIIDTIYKIIIKGLHWANDDPVCVQNFDELEKQIEKMELNSEPEPFFKAVAEAVAEAGPWDVSMEMVAKRLGLSKSSLYGHFKNKKDMLRRLFTTEFARIISFARMGISLSSDTAQQLYFGLFSITVYLRSRPEILIAMDWIRTRKLDLGKPDKNMEIFRLFEDIDITRNMEEAAEEDDKRRFSNWILFLLINILTHPANSFIKDKNVNSDIQNNDIRVLYKFITLGLGGFIR